MKKYQIIYADPPWQYGGSGGTKWCPASEYYKTLSFEKLKILNIDKYLAENCLLFLWVVNAELPKCIEVGESWRFKYITVGFVWHKRRANVGNYTMSGTEQCLIFKRGKIPQPRVRNPGVKQFYSETISKHSKKPDEFRKRIEIMFPKANKLELFATEKIRDWDIWGDEVKCDIDLKI